MKTCARRGKSGLAPAVILDSRGRKIMGRKNRKLFLLSLRVLARFCAGSPPSRRDLIVLRRHAPAAARSLPVDELCCALIRQELEETDRVPEPAP